MGRGQTDRGRQEGREEEGRRLKLRKAERKDLAMCQHLSPQDFTLSIHIASTDMVRLREAEVYLVGA